MSLAENWMSWRCMGGKGGGKEVNDARAAPCREQQRDQRRHHGVSHRSQLTLRTSVRQVTLPHTFRVFLSIPAGTFPMVASDGPVHPVVNRSCNDALTRRGG